MEEKIEIKELKNPKSFIDYSQTIYNIMKIWKTILQQREGEC